MTRDLYAKQLNIVLFAIPLLCFFVALFCLLIIFFVTDKSTEIRHLNNNKENLDLKILELNNEIKQHTKTLEKFNKIGIDINALRSDLHKIFNNINSCFSFLEISNVKVERSSSFINIAEVSFIYKTKDVRLQKNEMDQVITAMIYELFRANIYKKDKVLIDANNVVKFSIISKKKEEK